MSDSDCSAQVERLWEYIEQLEERLGNRIRKLEEENSELRDLIFHEVDTAKRDLEYQVSNVQRNIPTSRGW